MFDFVLSYNGEFADILNYDIKGFAERVRALDATVTDRQSYGRHMIRILCSARRKNAVVAEIKGFLIRCFCEILKRNYFVRALRCASLPMHEKELLIETLVAFDRETDCESVRRKLVLRSEISLDGFYAFKMSDDVARWESEARLATENDALFFDAEKFKLLLRFLLSTVIPKSETVWFCEGRDGGYFVKPDGGELLVVGSARELIKLFIDIAPIEVKLTGEMCNNETLCRICELFDVKTAFHALNFCENI